MPNFQLIKFPFSCFAELSLAESDLFHALPNYTMPILDFYHICQNFPVRIFFFKLLPNFPMPKVYIAEFSKFEISFFLLCRIISCRILTSNRFAEISLSELSFLRLLSKFPMPNYPLPKFPNLKFLFSCFAELWHA